MIYQKKDLILKGNGNILRGISQNKISIEVGIDNKGNCYCHVLEKGKPTSNMIKNSLVDHIVPGSTLIHDDFHGHGSLIEAINGTNIVSNTKDKDNFAILQNINQFCSLLKRIIMIHTGERRDNLQLYLDWACYRTKVYHIPIREQKKL